MQVNNVAVDKAAVAECAQNSARVNKIHVMKPRCYREMIRVQQQDRLMHSDEHFNLGLRTDD